MKKSFSKFALIALFSLFVFASCEKDGEPSTPAPVPPKTLDAPKNIAFDAKTLTFSWDKVKDATGYQCVLDNFLTIAFAEVYKNNTAVISNPKKDTWQIFYVRAVNGQVSSEMSSLEFIVTDKVLLSTPTNFVYDIIEKVDDVMKVKLSWSPVENATKYECNYSVIKGSMTISTGKTVSVPEITANSVSVGSTIIIRVRALPANGSQYVASKQGSAQVKDLK